MNKTYWTYSIQAMVTINPYRYGCCDCILVTQNVFRQPIPENSFKKVVVADAPIEKIKKFSFTPSLKYGSETRLYT